MIVTKNFLAQSIEYQKAEGNRTRFTSGMYIKAVYQHSKQVIMRSKVMQLYSGGDIKWYSRQIKNNEKTFQRAWMQGTCEKARS